MRHRHWIIVAFAASVLLDAHTAVARIPVEDLRPLLHTALANGRAEGVLGGVAARMLAQSSGVDAPLFVDVERLDAVSAGCAPLRITTTQRWPRRDAREAFDRRFSYALGFCADGRVLELPNESEGPR